MGKIKRLKGVKSGKESVKSK